MYTNESHSHGLGVISAGGLPRQLVDAAKAGEFELCKSEVLLAELLDVFSRSKFAARLAHAGLTPEGIVGELRRLAVVVSTLATPPRESWCSPIPTTIMSSLPRRRRVGRPHCLG